jgi:hypothetical protein
MGLIVRILREIPPDDLVSLGVPAGIFTAFRGRQDGLGHLESAFNKLDAEVCEAPL